MAARWDLVIFDSDGVLVDTEPLANQILNERLHSIGLPLTLEESARAFQGRSLPMCLQIIEDVLGHPAPEGFLDDVQRRTFAAFRRVLAPVPGVLETLDRIPWPTCVASSGDLLKIRTTLTLAGLIVRFEGRMFSALDVPHGKPAPDLFLHAAKTLGASPARTAVVEDSPVGIQAARAAGMTPFGYAARTGAGLLVEAGAAVVFREFATLPELLQEPP
ncbi:MAG TPA: HAD family hydrolase [Candidatus Polarisedimenticolaceae bacterium]|nr:HAD family hydrolase [Candidatus Polarisedimenticolaceae bacterium]